MRRLLAVRRISRDEIDVALHRGNLNRRAAEGDRSALSQLLQRWPDDALTIMSRPSEKADRS